MISISAPSFTFADIIYRISETNSTLQIRRGSHRFFGRRKWCRFSSIIVCRRNLENAKTVGEFPSFLPSEVVDIRDSAARQMARRIQRLPVQTSLLGRPIMSGCVMPEVQNREVAPVVLLHGFDSSCLEWRYTYPLLEAAGMESWAIDLLGWGFTSSEGVSSFSVAAKREHLYEFWRSYIKRPMVLVGASLGGAAAIDFAVFYPEAVSTLVLIDASVYAKGTGNMARFPKFIAYAGVGRLHCLLPCWEDATIDFMLSGGYKVASRIKEVQKKTLVLWGENDKIVSKDFAQRLQNDLQGSHLQYISECGHIPHVEKPDIVANLIIEFLKDKQGIIFHYGAAIGNMESTNRFTCY